MKKYQKPELTITDLSVINEIAALTYKGTAPDSGGIPVSTYEISSFLEESGEEE